jgi:hypothetical protein
MYLSDMLLRSRLLLMGASHRCTRPTYKTGGRDFFEASALQLTDIGAATRLEHAATTAHRGSSGPTNRVGAEPSALC